MLPVVYLNFYVRLCSEADYDPDTYKIPFVVVSLKALSAHVHSLLQSHEGTIPLLRYHIRPYSHASNGFGVR